MRVFLDTNVLISALATRGLCAELYERLLMEHGVVIGEPVVAEVLDIMHRTFSAGKKLLAKVEAELRLLEIVPAQSVAPKLPIKYREDPWIIACALARWRGKRIVLLREMPNCWGWEKWNICPYSRRELAGKSCWFRLRKNNISQRQPEKCRSYSPDFGLPDFWLLMRCLLSTAQDNEP